MTHQTTTYNNSGNQSLPLREVRRVFRKVFFLLIMIVMGVGSAWADTWDGSTKTAPDMNTNNGSTEALAIQITNAEELAWLGDQIRQGTAASGKTYGGKYWKLTADIDLGGNSELTGNDWASAIGNTTSAFCGYFDGGGHTVSNIQVASVTSAKYYGLFPSIQGASSSNLSKVKSLKIDGVYLKATTSMGATTRLGALTGYVKNGSIFGVAASNVTITYVDDITGANNIGGLIGFVEGDKNGGQQTTIKNNSVKNVKISIAGAVAEATYIGGAIGYLGAYALVDGMSVNGGSISGPTTEDKTVTNNKVFFVGGFLGYQHSSGTTDYQPNKFKNIAVSGLTINLAHFVPGGTINNHKFAVGGIAGSVNAPNQDSKGNRGMPENLIAKGVKIYAPYAATSPTVANFNSSVATYNNYTGENITSNIDAIEKSKSGSWLYSDYKLGLSTSVLSATNAYNDAAANGKVRRNYSASTTTDSNDSNLEWLSVDDNTFLRKNRYLDNERESWTVLWWTRTDNNASYANNDIEQTIYPQQNNADADKNPFATSAYKYYMYFYQGVANAKYVKATEADAIISGVEANVTEATKAEPLTLSIENEQEGQRGFAARTITVTPSSNDAVDSYKWYVDGVEQAETSNSIDVKPHWKLAKNIHVNAIKDSKVVASAAYALKVGVFKTKNNSGTDKEGMAIADRGTSTNPYIIDSEEALRQLSYLSTWGTGYFWEGLAKPASPANQSQGHYDRAYYEVDADITMSDEPFVPISHMGYSAGSSGAGDGTYHQNWIFQGSFDGKGHKISDLNITWGAGQYNGNDAHVYHGLFGAIGNTTATAKWGDGSTTSPTVIKNLVISNATLTHDTNNTSFYYNNGNSGNSNNCYVGVLAGIVGANTTIQNIEIRNSKITDEGSVNYSLATRGLYVGGAIGSVQAGFNAITNCPINVVIKNIVVGTDITLEHAKIQEKVMAQRSLFNVGGIIGRYVSTGGSGDLEGNYTNIQAVMPKYTLYTGTINAKEAWISPVIAATRYKAIQTINKDNLSKIYEGNNNNTEQLNVEDALYYNFKIVDRTGTERLITDDYPANICKNESRTLDSHSDGNETEAGYQAQKYQGVNYAAVFCDAAVYGTDADGGKRMAIAILNSHDDVDVYWEWKSDETTPHMTSTRTIGAYIVSDTETEDKYNVVGTAAGDDKYYKWYVDDIEQSEHSASITLPTDIINFIINAEVYENSSAGSPIAKTQYLVIKGEFKIVTSMNHEEGSDVYTVGLTIGGTDIITNPDSRFIITYQWYKGNNVNEHTATKIDGQTTSSVTITKDALGEVNNLFCHVKITLRDSNPERILFEGNVSQYVLDANVIFLQLQDSFVDSNGETHNKPAKSGVGSVDDPVTSWANAYAKIKGYTVPTKEYVTGHGGTWTSATSFDDEDYYLANKDTYEYDTYKCDGNKRKVRPIEQCTNNWDNNIIVLMGLAKDGYFNDNNNVDGGRANKPVTITGQFNGTNYYGFLCHTSGDLSLNADHKFENIGLGVNTSNSTINSSIRYRIYAHRWNLWAGRGLLMGWAAAEAWGTYGRDQLDYRISNADPSTGTPVDNYTADIAIMGGYLNDNTSDNPEMFEYINHGRDDIGQQIKIESGFWGPVCPGNRQTDSAKDITTYYTMGGPDYPAKTTITVDIYREDNDGNEKFNSAMAPATVDVGCLLTGNHEGTMYADVTLNILSGHMGRIVNGIKGAQRRQMTKPESFTTEGHYRHIINYGSKETPVWREIAAPAPDSFFGRGILNFDPNKSVNNTGVGNDAINVIELYCGSLGRGHNDGNRHPEIRSYFYGLSEINIKGGKFEKTIYGAGAGGVNGIGTAEHHTDDDGIPYWNTDIDPGKTRVWYAPYDYIKGNGHNYDFVKVKIQGIGSDDTNLEDGYVNLGKTRNIINITGGIFGSKSSPASIYGGGYGEANASLINPSEYTNDADNVKNTYNTPNHQGGNMYGTKDGFVTQINISGDAKIYGNIYGGGMGSMRYYRYFVRAGESIVNYTAENQTYTHIMNPGGDTYNKPGGIDWQKIINTRRNADNYLNVGQVFGNTKISISGDVEVFGNVYGAGEGVPDMTVEEFFSSNDTEFKLTDQLSSKNAILNYEGTATNGKRTAHITADDTWVAFPNLGKLYGDSKVIIEGNTHIHGNVYGGGKAGAMDGNSTVVVKSGIIEGDVFGAGEGEADRPDKAKVTGNTNVIVDENWTETTATP